MEIKSITVNANYCFGESPLVLDDLKRVNFIFAPNGAGKSTISNALSRQPRELGDRTTWDTAPTDLPIRVFNEEYRSKVLTETVNGIFTIGDKSQEIDAAINDLINAKNERRANRERWELAVGSNKDAEKLHGALGNIEAARISVQNAVFEAHKHVDRAVVPIVFEGFRRDREKFLAEALRRHAELDRKKNGADWDSIKTRTASLTGNQSKRQPLPRIDTVSLVKPDEITELATKVSHGGGGHFATLVQQLRNEDWVSQGRSYLTDSQGKCPFCQTEVPPNLEDDLSRYFEGGFDAALERSNIIEASANSNAVKLEQEISVLEEALVGDLDETFSSAIAALRSGAELVLSRLSEKSRHPTRPVTVVDTYDAAVILNDLVESENLTIRKHNTLVSNAASERVRLVNDGWSAFLTEVAIDREINRFNGIKSSNERRACSLQEDIEKSINADSEADREIAELRSSISNTVAVAERINELLRAIGFHRFHLKVAGESAGGYRIAREDGTLAFDSLSEGEKSFICFAYFWESLFGTLVSDGTPEDVVSVIDDPISSLDSDTLFMIASYVRDAAAKAIKGNSTVRQLIVLTHNTQFHHEAAYSGSNSESQRRYFRLVKNPDGFTTVRDDGRRSKVRGSYALLWDSVVEAARGDDESELVRVGVYNIVRRILESYFRTIGRVKDFDRPKDASPTEERIISQFHIWANSGSHTISDDIDQTVEVGRTSDFLRLFKRYFDVQGHNAHFDMMIDASDGADLKGPGEIFARA